MAKITIEFDTLEKTVAVAQDGTPVENVTGVNVYRQYGYDGYTDKYAIDVHTFSKDDATGVKVNTVLMAADKGLVAKAGLSDKTASAIASYLSR